MADFTGANVTNADPSFGDISINPVGEEILATPSLLADGVPGRFASYFQRVWDAGTVGWCYYSKPDADPAPLASETSPNYTGAISHHSVLRIF